MSSVFLIQGVIDSPVRGSVSELDIEHFYPSELNRDQFHLFCLSVSLIIEFYFFSITLKKASTKRFLVLLILSQTQYILCFSLILQLHLLFPSPIPNYAWFCLFLPYLSICLDVRPPCFFQSFSPAAFVTWGGNSAGLNATVFREGLISRVQTRSFSSRILFPVHSFFPPFSFFLPSSHYRRESQQATNLKFSASIFPLPGSNQLCTGRTLLKLCWTDHAVVDKKVEPACAPTYYNV